MMSDYNAWICCGWREYVEKYWLTAIALIAPLTFVLSFIGIHEAAWLLIIPGLVFIPLAIYLVVGFAWLLIKEIIKDK